MLIRPDKSCYMFKDRKDCKWPITCDNCEYGEYSPEDDRTC